MYLTNIKLINFGLHKSTSINLEGGFVCISGDTAAGKTTVVNALNFLFNDAWSDSNVRFGEKVAKIIVTLDNGIIVAREKGNGVNKITITYPDSSVKEFVNFGIQAPLEVKQILGVVPLNIDSDYSEDINIHMQDDPHFLIKKSAPMKTKFINRITRLHIVDATNRTLVKDLTDTNKSIQECEAKQTKLTEIVASYGNLDLEKIRLSSISDKIIKLTQEIESVSVKFDKLYTLATITASYLKKKTLYERREKLIIRISGIKSLYTNYVKYNRILLMYAKVHQQKLFIDVHAKYLTVYNNFLNTYKNYDKVTAFENLCSAYSSKEKEISATQDKLDAMKKLLEYCPTCGKPLGVINAK